MDTFVCATCGETFADVDAHRARPDDPLRCPGCFVPPVSTMTERELMDLLVDILPIEAVIA